MELDVPLTHTILATGEEQIIRVETYDIPAMYQYHAVPYQRKIQHTFSPCSCS